MAEDSQVAQILDAFGEVVEGVGALNETVQENTRERRRTRVWLGLAIVLATLLIILQSLGLYEARQGREQIIDCTTADGKCFQENTERSGKRIGAVVTEIACADARDTRSVLDPILDRVLPSVEAPPLPPECAEEGTGAG